MIAAPNPPYPAALVPACEHLLSNIELHDPPNSLIGAVVRFRSITLVLESLLSASYPPCSLDEKTLLAGLLAGLAESIVVLARATEPRPFWCIRRAKGTTCESAPSKLASALSFLNEKLWTDTDKIPTLRNLEPLLQKALVSCDYPAVVALAKTPNTIIFWHTRRGKKQDLKRVYINIEILLVNIYKFAIDDRWEYIVFPLPKKLADEYAALTDPVEKGDFALKAGPIAMEKVRIKLACRGPPIQEKNWKEHLWAAGCITDGDLVPSPLWKLPTYTTWSRNAEADEGRNIWVFNSRDRTKGHPVLATLSVHYLREQHAQTKLSTRPIVAYMFFSDLTWETTHDLMVCLLTQFLYLIKAPTDFLHELPNQPNRDRGRVFDALHNITSTFASTIVIDGLDSRRPSECLAFMDLLLILGQRTKVLCFTAPNKVFRKYVENKFTVIDLKGSRNSVSIMPVLHEEVLEPQTTRTELTPLLSATA